MKDDSGLKIDDANDSTYSPKRRRIESGDGKSLAHSTRGYPRLAFAGGISYFLSKRPTVARRALWSQR